MKQTRFSTTCNENTINTYYVLYTLYSTLFIFILRKKYFYYLQKLNINLFYVKDENLKYFWIAHFSKIGTGINKFIYQVTIAEELAF